jgi:hypothetical protein
MAIVLFGSVLNDYSSAVAPSKWLSHFQSLGELKESYKVRLSQLERRLDDLEKIPCYNDLDNVISQKEITSAISKLKNKKAPGLVFSPTEIVLLYMIL